MKALKVIENELVPVYETSTGEKVVYGTELHEVLQVKTPYRIWIERRFEECETSEHEDFEGVQICTPSGQTKKDYIIKLDTAKEMAMLERNEKGKQVRRYFIQVEKKYKEIRERVSEQVSEEREKMRDGMVPLEAIPLIVAETVKQIAPYLQGTQREEATEEPKKRQRIRICCKIDQLPLEIREQINRMLYDPTNHYEDISYYCKENGYDISRSSVGRYYQRHFKQSKDLNVFMR